MKLDAKWQDRLGEKGERDRVGGDSLPTAPEAHCTTWPIARHAQVVGFPTLPPSRQQRQLSPHGLVGPSFATISVLPSEPSRAASQAAFLGPRSRSTRRKGPAGDSDISEDETVAPQGWALRAPKPDPVLVLNLTWTPKSCLALGKSVQHIASGSSPLKQG